MARRSAAIRPTAAARTRNLPWQTTFSPAQRASSSRRCSLVFPAAGSLTVRAAMVSRLRVAGACEALATAMARHGRTAFGRRFGLVVSDARIVTWCWPDRWGPTGPEEGDEHGHRAGRVAGRRSRARPSTPRSSSSAPGSPASISCTCCVRPVSTSAWSRPAPTSGERGTGTATRAPASTPRATPTGTSSRPSCSPSGTGRSTSLVRPRPRRT